MACNSITEIVVSESNRILPGEIYSRTFPRSLWLSIVDRGEYPEQMGYDPLTVLTYERTAPTDANPSWTLVDLTGSHDNVEGGACLPPAHLIQFGSTKRTVSLYEYVGESPDFCAVNLRTAFELQMQLGKIFDNMGLWARLMWETRNRHEYFRLTNYKVVADGNPCMTTLTEGVEDFSTWTCGTGPVPLTQGMLDWWRLHLLRDGAPPDGLADGDPQLTLITDSETSENIFLMNGDRRSDLRYGEPHKLLAPFGVGGPYKGFYHSIDPFPIRYNFTCTDGTITLTEVAPFTVVAATKGFKVIVNSAWESAQLTVSHIFNRKVYQQLIPRPIVAPHPEYKFDPVTYTGVWTAKNILDRKCNPDGTIIYFRWHAMSGSLPIHPEYGVSFLHLRCGPPCGAVTACPPS